MTDALATPGRRLDSLDVLRGLTIGAMLMVNNPGSWAHIYWPLEHAAWSGWTLTDLVFPFFLFMVGMSMMYSFPKRLEAGDSRKTLFGHVVRRAAALVLLGWWGGTWSRILWPGDGAAFLAGGSAEFLAGLLLRLGFVAAVVTAVVLLVGTQRKAFWRRALWASLVVFALGAAKLGLDDPLLARLIGMRYPGVLVRIGACYLLASGIYFWTPDPRKIVYWIVGLLGFYAVWMMLIPIPGFGLPDLSQGFPTEDTRISALFSNWAFYIDFHVLGSHTWSARQLFDPAGNLIWSFDPEGLISTISAVCSVLFGILAGVWMRRKDLDDSARLNGLFVGAAWLMGIGLVVSIWMPINKRLWTSSYTVFTSGMALLVLATLFHLVDMRGFRRWAQPFRAYGRNAIFAFVASGMMATTMGNVRLGDTSVKAVVYDVLQRLTGNPEMGSFVFAIAFVTLWGGITMWMDRRKMYFKV
jgi:predicted acyltransferase